MRGFIFLLLICLLVLPLSAQAAPVQETVKQKDVPQEPVIQEAPLNNSPETKEDYTLLGDSKLKDKDYKSASEYYFKALELDTEDINLKNILAFCYRKMGLLTSSSRLYCDILSKEPANLNAKMGLGTLELEKKKYSCARRIFCEILSENTDYKPAKMGIVYSYLANGEMLNALKVLNTMSAQADIKLLKSRIYYKLGMYSDSLKNLPGRSECGLPPPDEGGKTSPNNYVQSTESLNKGKFRANSRYTCRIPTEREDESPLFGYGFGKQEDSETFMSLTDGADLYLLPTQPEHLQSPEFSQSNLLKAGVYANSQELKYNIKKAQAVTLIPSASFLSQQLEDEFDLDYSKFGLQLSQNTKNNSNVFMQYNVIVYKSGGKTGLVNVTNEFIGGIQSRPNEKWEYHADLGVKVFQFGDGAMILADNWIKHYFHDKFNVKVGYRRNNIEQSYLSAVGEALDGVFTGRAVDNKIYLEFEYKLPYGFHAFGRGGYGVIPAQNLQTNQYGIGMLGIGKILYNKPDNHWINLFGVDFVCYNSAYQYDLIKVYNNAGNFFGGYYSPSYFNSETLNFKLEGSLKKIPLRYGIKAFGGIQTAMSPDSTTPAWGAAPYFSYELNDHLSINASYSYYNYAGVQRNLFTVSAVIKFFKKNSAG